MTDDERNWRQVKDASGVYVHRAEAHDYPGPGGWDEGQCSMNDHARCLKRGSAA